jgi:hypothetical protein
VDCKSASALLFEALGNYQGEQADSLKSYVLRTCRKVPILTTPEELDEIIKIIGHCLASSLQDLWGFLVS